MDNLTRLELAMAEFSAEPTRVIPFRREKYDPLVPSSINILAWTPPEGPREADVTMMATAGMSLRALLGPVPRMELFIGILGRRDETTQDQLACELAELAVLPFRHGRCYSPGMVLIGAQLTLFSAMDHLLLTEWGGSQPSFLHTRPPVRLCTLVPVFDSELALIDARGASATVALFYRLGLDPGDPDRRPAA